MKLATKIIDRKISLEYLLNMYSNFEKLKILVLDKEQINSMRFIENFKLENHFEQLLI